MVGNAYFKYMQGRKNYQEKLFTSFQLSDRVPQENIYRKLLQVLDFKFLYKQTSIYYGKEGQASIDPVVFFKLMLVGYLENILSDRRIIQAASLRLDILYFIGYDIDEQLPWHSTLSRTRQLYGEEVFLSLFKKVLMVCIDKGMVSGRRQAVDSVLIKANASMESLLEKEILEDAEAFSLELKGNKEEAPSIQIKPVNEEAKNKKGRNNKTHYSPSDPDAKISTKPGKPYQLNYLGQVSVDTEGRVITHVEAFTADKRDSQCLQEVVEQTKENLKEGGLELEEVLADANYSSAESLEALEELKVRGYIPNFGGYKSMREGFTYDKENDRYICSQGKFLNYKGLKNNYSLSKQYLSSPKDCKDCPLKTSCIGKSNQKMITETLSRPLFQQMEKRVKTWMGRKMKRLRHSTVEPVIGSLVNYYGIKKLNTKGKSNATKCMTMAAMAYNIKKLLKYKKLKSATNIKSIERNIIRRANGIDSLLYIFKLKLKKKPNYQRV
jgi:transposase